MFLLQRGTHVLILTVHFLAFSWVRRSINIIPSFKKKTGCLFQPWVSIKETFEVINLYIQNTLYKRRSGTIERWHFSTALWVPADFPPKFLVQSRALQRCFCSQWQDFKLLSNFLILSKTYGNYCALFFYSLHVSLILPSHHTD